MLTIMRWLEIPELGYTKGEEIEVGQALMIKQSVSQTAQEEEEEIGGGEMEQGTVLTTSSVSEACMRRRRRRSRGDRANGGGP